MLFSFPKQNEGIHYTFGLHGNLLRQLNRNSCYAQNGLSADYAKTAQTSLELPDDKKTKCSAVWNGVWRCCLFPHPLWWIYPEPDVPHRCNNKSESIWSHCY